MIFDGFAASAAALCPRQEDSSDPLLNLVQGSTLIPTPTLDPGRVSLSENGSVSLVGPLPFVKLPTEYLDAILDLALGNHPKLSRFVLIESDQVSYTELSPANP